MNFTRVPIFILQILVFAHFILTVWANQCAWLPVSYLFCNFFVLALGVGTVIASTDHTISEMFILGMAFSLLHDIIIVAVTYDGDTTPRACRESDHFRFSFGMSILNIILKPVSLVAIVLNYIDRGDGGFRIKVAEFRASRGTSNEAPNEPLPPVSYGNQAY